MYLFSPNKEATMSHIFALYLSYILIAFSVSATNLDYQIEPVQTPATEIEPTKKKTPYSCDQCRDKHVACNELKGGKTSCERCIIKGFGCTWVGKELSTRRARKMSVLTLADFTSGISADEQHAGNNLQKTKRKYCKSACDQCREKHQACNDFKEGETQCHRCKDGNISCSWITGSQVKVRVKFHPQAKSDMHGFQEFSFNANPNPPKPQRAGRHGTRIQPYPAHKPRAPENKNAMSGNNLARGGSLSQAALNHRQGQAGQSWQYSTSNLGHFSSGYGEGSGSQYSAFATTGSYPFNANSQHQGNQNLDYSASLQYDQYQALDPMPQVPYYASVPEPYYYYCMEGSDYNHTHNGGATAGFGEYVNSDYQYYHNPNTPSSPDSLSSQQNQFDHNHSHNSGATAGFEEYVNSDYQYQDDGLDFFNDDN
jgi:hypothetical protein